ncbi:phosphate ABC transporter permease PstA [Halobellus captivus]|uniref:phosphate ABC transporter permease PstA n=1 Tax=Halobellus captivus TaxID=2592614 RepID=UPI0011A20FF7|nr:phosphate ABC transporter permease PstA [Halobellus captivus]
MAQEQSAGSGQGFAGDSGVSRIRGRVFEWLTLGATVFGLVMVTALLAYVFNDAIRPFSADPLWHLVYATTVVLPALVLLATYYTSDEPAGEVAIASTGIPIVGLVAGSGLVVLFIELLTPADWFGLVVGLVCAAAVVRLHQLTRPNAAVERLFVIVLAPLLAITGIPAMNIQRTFSSPLTTTEIVTIDAATPSLLPSVGDVLRPLLTAVPGWVLLVAAVTLPVATLFGRQVAARRGDGRGVREVVVGSVGLVAVGSLVAPLFGLAPQHWVLLATTAVLPTGVYLEGVVRRRTGVLGVAFPIVLGAGLVLGTALTNAFGLAGPSSWIGWDFLTSPTSITPEDAGIYPPLVGSVLMLVVIITLVFPIGVGAAIYLEEYAPKTGARGRLVELIEINIGNLAGVPSVVYGLLGLGLFVKGIGLDSGIVIVGGLTVGLLILPIVIISAQEAVRAVPDSLRRASYGMGATKWQTTRNVVLPRALPGILTGTILALGRAIGETAPLLMIGAAASVRLAPNGFFDKFSAMPRQIFAWSSEFDPDFRFGVLAAGVVTLLLVLLLMNGTAILIRNRYQRSD